ncbi:MAG: riboflavin synthase [bacterium]
MFTGIIEELGTVQRVLRQAGGLNITVQAGEVGEDNEVGHSIAVNGVCLTVTRVDGQSFTAQVVEETARKTTLGRIRVGDRVNLERALRLSQRLGGHIVTGHVDGMGIVRSRVERENSTVYSIDVPRELVRYVVIKGSVAVDGVSLTVADILGSQMAVSIIPHTAKVTTFGFRKAGDEVNIEVDLIGKYAQKLMESRRETITEAWLRERGY